MHILFLDIAIRIDIMPLSKDGGFYHEEWQAGFTEKDDSFSVRSSSPWRSGTVPWRCAWVTSSKQCPKRMGDWMAIE